MSKREKDRTQNRQPCDAIIVGAGAAGLFAADRLNRAGLSFVVLESADHAGGRIQSRREQGSHLGLMIDEGANLINSTDQLAIGLMDRFSISYVKRLLPRHDHMHYVFNGKAYDQAAMQELLFAQENMPLGQMMDDQDLWGQAAKRDTDPRFINESIAEYLGRIGSGRLLLALLDSFFWSEYGRRLDELNLHVLFDYLHIDARARSFRLIPNADEAYTVPGGTGQIITALQESLVDHIRFNHHVSRITDKTTDRVMVECRDAQGRTESFEGQSVIFAAPLHRLSEITVSMEGLKPDTLLKAQAATYALGTKLHLKFSAGFHRIYQFRGIVLTDSGEQIWPSDTGQGEGGLLTVLTGPMTPGSIALDLRVKDVLKKLDIVAPGCSNYFVGAERTDAPMSYSGSLRPGEAAQLSIRAGTRRWFTVGEASGGELQGYLEGAFKSAERETTRLMVQLRKSPASRL